MVPCSRSLPAQHRCGGGHCPAKNQQGADEAELGAQQWLTLHQYHHYHTVTEQSCFRENVSSKRRTANYFYWLYSSTHNLHA